MLCLHILESVNLVLKYEMFLDIIILNSILEQYFTIVPYFEMDLN